MRRKTQMRFLCPWSNQILNLLIAANNNKRSEPVCIMEVWSVVSAKNVAWQWTHTERIWHDRSQINFDACATELSVQCSCIVGPSWTQDRIVVEKTVETWRIMEWSTARWLIPMIGFLLALEQDWFTPCVNATKRDTWNQSIYKYETSLFLKLMLS